MARIMQTELQNLTFRMKEEMSMNAADTGFVLVSAMLVMLMVPALALFYGGLVASRNVLSTTMHSFVLLGVSALLWPLVGYTLAFGPDIHGLIGGFENIMLFGVGKEPLNGGSIPALAFMAFQCMFAALTPALISGAYAERIHFQAMLIFSTLWLLVVYCPMAQWVWGGGWLMQMGALDFAGGAVVHMSSGSAALAAAIALGRRSTMGRRAGLPHNIPMTVLGAGLLWFGWFGFNAGSALAANGLAANALVTTHLSAGCAILGWLAVERWHTGHFTVLGAASGAVAGLVVITPAAGFVEPWAAVVMGLLGGAVCYGGIFLKSLFNYDDALDVVGIHGVGGVLGALLTGVFASASVNGVDGLLYGNPHQLWVQFVSVIATIGFCFPASYVLLKITDALVGLRVPLEKEVTGLDISEHSESGYQI